MSEDSKTTSSSPIPTLATAHDMRLAARPGTIRNLISRTPESYADLVRYVQRLHDEQFFGALVIEFVKGEINLIRVNQSLKPWNLADAESPATTLGTTTRGGVE
jgi:hypothetical protein